MTLYLKGNKILIDGELKSVTIEIEHGKIKKIHSGISLQIDNLNTIDAGDKIVMAGLVDSHVHVNEPGREEWEGFWTATKAAAAGGVTTIIDMPLNSIPPTTTLKNFETKIKSTDGKLHVDVGFWGGVVPGNALELKSLVSRGVIGFKCFLIESGVDEFPCVHEKEVDEALSQLEGTGSLLAFHAEIDTGKNEDETPTPNDKNQYTTFLNSRPPKMESKAIEMVTRLCQKHKNVRCHIVHLSAAEALPLISDTRAKGYPLTVETCPHYLTLSPDEIGPCRTEYKCCPPIRDVKNQDLLWDGLRSGLIDMIVSDHSPCTVNLKKPGEIDFMEAWGGIASVQFGLPIIWSNASKRGFGFKEISIWMSKNPAKLAGLGGVKGEIKEGFDADFVIWDSEAEIQINDDSIHHKNKVTPYKGKALKGKVCQTILRGETIYKDGVFTPPKGQLLIPTK